MGVARVWLVGFISGGSRWGRHWRIEGSRAYTSGSGVDFEASMRY